MRRRSAFTLVELLVTMALIIFMMAILSEAFVVGLETFRQLKAIGDMNERLRAGVSEIRTDLQADHFGGKQRLSDSNIWATGLPPREGFFRIYTNPGTTTILPYGSMPSQLPAWNGTGQRSFFEGQDGDGIPSCVVTDMVLHMCVKQRANRQERFLSAKVPAGSTLIAMPGSPSASFPTQTTVDPTLSSPDARYQDSNANSYSSPWVEVAYFLVKNGDFAGSTPLFTLYRAQYVVVPDNSQLNWPTNPIPGVVPVPPPSYQEMSCEVPPEAPYNGNQVYFNSPTDLSLPPRDTQPPPMGQLAYPQRRAFDPTQAILYDPNTNPPPASATFVVGDVISLEIQVLLPGATSFQYVQNFDTATTPGVIISAVQITIRVWDKKTLQTRQITIVQDM